MRTLLLAAAMVAVPAVASAASAAVPASMRIAALPVPGPPAFVLIARDVVGIVASLDPSVAAGAGLFEDSVRVPTFEPSAVAALVSRIDHDLAALRALPWRSYPVDEQIDYRWIFANAETAKRQLLQERLLEHRPAQWLEPVSNTLIALVSYVPDRTQLERRVLALVPKMVGEIQVLSHPTRRDIDAASKLTLALVAMAKQTASPEGNAAATSLSAYARYLRTLSSSVDHETIGAASYAWRYRHTALLPWTPDELLREAQSALVGVDAELDALKPKIGATPEPTLTQREEARALTRDSLLGLYDGIEVSLRAATLKGGIASGVSRARTGPTASGTETPWRTARGPTQPTRGSPVITSSCRSPD